MATGVTYQDLDVLTLNSSESYVNCVFLRIKKIQVASAGSNAMVTCTFTDCPDVLCDFSLMQTCVVTRCTFTVNQSGSTLYWYSTTATDSYFYKTSSRTVSLSAGTYTGGVIAGRFNVEYNGSPVVLTGVTVKGSPAYDGVLLGNNLNMTDCVFENIVTVSVSNLSLANCSGPKPSKVTLQNCSGGGVSGGTYDILIMDGANSSFSFQPSKVSVVNYPSYGTWSSVPLTTAVDTIQYPVPMNMTSCSVYGAKGIDVRKHSVAWTDVTWQAPAHNLKLPRLSRIILGHHASPTTNPFRNCDLTDSPRLEFTAGGFYVRDFDMSGSNLYNTPSGAMFMGNNVKGRGCNMSNLFRADISKGTTIRGWDFRDAVWNDAYLNGLKFVDCDFRGTVFNGGYMQNCSFANTSFKGANFNFIDTTGTDFSGADMTSGYTRFDDQLSGWSPWPYQTSSNAFSVGSGQSAAFSVIVNYIGRSISTGLLSGIVWVLSEKTADSHYIQSLVSVNEDYLDANAIQKITVSAGASITFAATPVAGRYYLVVKNTGSTTRTVQMQ